MFSRSNYRALTHPHIIMDCWTHWGFTLTVWWLMTVHFLREGNHPSNTSSCSSFSRTFTIMFTHIWSSTSCANPYQWLLLFMFLLQMSISILFTKYVIKGSSTWWLLVNQIPFWDARSHLHWLRLAAARPPFPRHLDPLGTAAATSGAPWRDQPGAEFLWIYNIL